MAKLAIEEDDIYKKAELLSVFKYSKDSFPLPVKPLIEYARLYNTELQENCLEILINCRDDEIRSLAQDLLKSGYFISYAIQMLITNYRESDKKLLLNALYSLDVDYTEKSFWHSVGMSILNASDRGVKLPKEFFIYIYETTLCSCCRENAVRALGKSRQLSKDIIEECRFDSNYDIVQYVNRYHP